MIALLFSAKNYLAERKLMIRVPRILIVVPGILAGIFVPSLIVTAPKPAPPNTVGMTNMDFTKDVVTLHRGEQLVLVNSSHNIHVVGPGQNGQVVSPVRGEPLTGFQLCSRQAYGSSGWRWE